MTSVTSKKKKKVENFTKYFSFGLFFFVWGFSAWLVGWFLPTTVYNFFCVVSLQSAVVS